MIFIETLANPTDGPVDTAMVRRVAEMTGRAQGHTPIVACDNTLLGPVFLRPIEHGADFTLYSLTNMSRSFRPDRWRCARVKSPHEGRQSAARRHPHPTGPAFLLDDQPLARNTEPSHGKADRNAHLVAQYLRDYEKVASLTTRQTGRGPAIREAMHWHRFHIFVRYCRRKSRRIQISERAETLQAGSEPGRYRVACQPTRKQDALRCYDSHPGKIGVLDSTIRLSIGIEHPSGLIAYIAHALTEA